MKVIIFFLATILWGFAGHLTRPFMVDKFTDGGRVFDGWFAVGSYTIGIVMAFSAVLVQVYLLASWLIGRCRRALSAWDVVLISFVAGVLGFFSFGIGTVAGHWWLPDKVIPK